MAKVLIANDAILCGALPKHGGKVTVVSTAKLTVNHQAVLLESSVVGKPIAGCSVSPPPPGNSPCTSVLAIIASSLAQKLTVGGQPVVLETLSGTTAPSNVPPGAVYAPAAGQSKLSTV